MDTMQANLKDKEYLEELKLEWRGENENSEKDRNLLERLQPHKNLKKLTVRHYGGTRFPDWIGDCHSLPRIVFLELSDCKYCFSLPPLGQLPSLKELWISGFDKLEAIGREFYFYGNDSSSNSKMTQPFRSLEILRIEDMMSWKEWCCCFEGDNEASGGIFPCLQDLHIYNCPRLKEQLPQQLPSLKNLALRECQKLVSSLPRAPTLMALVLEKCEEMSFGDVPTFPSLKMVIVGGSHVSESLLKDEGVLLTNITCLEQLCMQDSDFPNLLWPKFRQNHNSFYNSLQTLCINGCNSLSSLSLDLFPKLRKLDLWNCRNLQSLSVSSVSSVSVSKGQHYLTTSLIWLKIMRCPKFISLSQLELGAAGGSSSLSLNLNAPALESIILHDLENTKSLPDLLPSLQYLWLYNCPQLESFPGGSFPSNLTVPQNRC
ncbi:Disease resistance protein [Quillaja saponaria]|uniref:Disease resistance protein n=1 Tax=Quillaja saponaria TaxID=32244 RepID=A0AAD7L111_QUISA|nr:Disease resistance protein [Quillaja saponaria]